MRFLDFEFFPYMLLPSLILLYLVLTNKSLLERIFAPEILRKLKLDQGLSRRMRLVTLFLALLFMIVALARPVYERGEVEVKSKEGYLVIALDVSKSMKVRDLYPNRLEFAKKKIEEFIKNSHNLSIGLIAFAKDAFIVSPATDDTSTLLFMLRRLDTKMLQLRGTDIAAAILSAKFLLKGVKRKNLLLVTDGGDGKDFSSAIALAKDAGMKVYILGIGTKKGAPLKENGHFVKDKNGNIVILKRNDAIAALAKATGGIYIPASLSNDDIKGLLHAIKGFDSTQKSKKIIDQVELYPYPLVIALLFLFLALFDLPTKNIAFVFLFLPYLSFGSILDFQHIHQATQAYNAQNYKRAIKEFEEVVRSKASAQSYYDLANAYYKAGLYQKALQTYKKVTTSDQALEFKKLYNMGNSYFKLAQYKKAIQMYKKALKIKNDADAKANLELAKKMLKKKKSSSNQKKKESKKEQKQSQNNRKDKHQNEHKQGSSKSTPQKEGSKKSLKKEESSKKSEKKQKIPQPTPIPDREEKKWQKELQKASLPTLLYQAPIKLKKEGHNENPW